MGEHPRRLPDSALPGLPPSHYLLPWLQVQSTWPNIFWEKEDEEVHNSVRYGQLIAHLIKKRVIKIGCLMDDSVRINNSLLVRCSDLLQS